MKSLHYVLVVFSLTIKIGIAQNGPGGIEDTDGASNLILWLDADQISGIADGSNITTWEDLSGYENDVSQSTTNNKPNYQTNIRNGFPAVQFNGSNEEFNGSFGATNAPITVIAVPYFDGFTQGSPDNDYVYSMGTVNSNGYMVSISRRDGFAVGANQYYSNDGPTARFGPYLNGQQWLLISQTINNSSTYHRMYLNGASQSVTDYTTNLTTDGEIRIGDKRTSFDGTHQFDGYLPEFIMFNKVLNSAELNIIQSYLAAKYNLSISNDKYVGDLVGNGDHDWNVAGIGTESDGSNNSASSFGVTITQNSGFGNGDYALLGHKEEDNEVNTIDASDAGGNLEARWERVWWLDYTNSGAGITADFSFDISESGLAGEATGTITDYKLLYRSSTSGNWTLLSSATSTNGDEINFSNVSVASDGYYTIGTIDETNSPIGDVYLDTGNDGPGGIGSTDGTTNLELWLDLTRIEGTSGNSVSSLTDYSGNLHHATSSGGGNPTLQTSVVNGNSVVRFNGSNNYFTGNLTAPLTAPASVLAVGYFGSINQGNGDNDYLVSFGAEGFSGSHLGISRRESGVPSDINKYYSWDGITTRFGPVITGQQWDVHTNIQNSSVQRHWYYRNGASQSVTDYTVNFSGFISDYSVGRWNNDGHYLNGDMAEVIVYDKLLNSAELNILHSYIGAKYNLTITNDKYTGDDVGNGDHDFYVAGIGTESDGSNSCASTKGIYLCQNANFGNGDYLLAGTTTADNKINTLDASDGSSTIVARWERVWWMDVTDAGSAISVDATFDFSDADNLVFPGGTASCYKLIYRSGTSGNWTILASGVSISGDQVNFTGVSFANDGYYTLGSCDLSLNPLPVELVYFNVFPSEREISGENIAEVKWITATENNNDFFTVEKSKDGLNFAKIATISGAGNSFDSIEYELNDLYPFDGTSFYRLKQTDLDGKFSYSNIVSVNFENLEKILVFPNPSDGSDVLNVILNLQKNQVGQIKLFNILGKLVYSENLILKKGMNKLSKNFGEISNGTYQLLILTEGKTYTTRYLKSIK